MGSYDFSLSRIIEKVVNFFKRLKAGKQEPIAAIEKEGDDHGKA